MTDFDCYISIDSGRFDSELEVFDWDNMATDDESERCDLFSGLSDIEDIIREEEKEEEKMSVSDSDTSDSMGDAPPINNPAPVHVFHIYPDQIYTQDSDGDNMLHTAIICDKTDLAIGMINVTSEPRLLSIPNRKFRQTPLHLAVKGGNMRVVRRLVVGGADLSAQDYKGNTPVHLACGSSGGFKMVDELLRPVQQIELVENRYSYTLQNLSTCLEKLNFDRRLTALHVAAQHHAKQHRHPIVDLLIQKGANVNAIEGLAGKTVFHKACEDGDLELVRYLIELEDCNINATSYNKDTAFDYARYRGHEEITTFLAKYGAEASAEEQAF